MSITKKLSHFFLSLSLLYLFFVYRCLSLSFCLSFFLSFSLSLSITLAIMLSTLSFFISLSLSLSLSVSFATGDVCRNVIAQVVATKLCVPCVYVLIFLFSYHCTCVTSLSTKCFFKQQDKIEPMQEPAGSGAPQR
jgi:hypothetical protein